MNVLAIDTASPLPGVGLIFDDRLSEEPLPDDRRASEQLLPAITRILQRAGARLEDCARLAVCSGPGSFTGVRVGLATAWGLGRSLGIPVEAVSTLEALAQAAVKSARVARLTAVLDAGRGEIVAQLFAVEQPRVRSLGPAKRELREDFREHPAASPLVYLPEHLLPVASYPLASSLAGATALAVARAPRETEEKLAAAIYARSSAAEEKRGAP